MFDNISTFVNLKFCQEHSHVVVLHVLMYELENGPIDRPRLALAFIPDHLGKSFELSSVVLYALLADAENLKDIYWVDHYEVDVLSFLHDELDRSEIEKEFHGRSRLIELNFAQNQFRVGLDLLAFLIEVWKNLDELFPNVVDEGEDIQSSIVVKVDNLTFSEIIHLILEVSSFFHIGRNILKKNVGQ